MKEKILDFCKNELDAKKVEISKEIASIMESIGSDTKSSAGDKYETGREMMNQEKDKLQSQLVNINRQLGTLHQINPLEKYDTVNFGALVKTSMAIYFISISYGKMTIDGEEVFLISAITPLAQQMMGKKAGDKLDWNGKEILIKDIL
ncbi:3-oxoacyl-ACP synthase [Marivirga sp.]|uniref:3-oxoacyl-ACP synthase n=1 Tax=Marivirga sp. TaxID=2018662 RepID=UPI003DA701E2